MNARMPRNASFQLDPVTSAILERNFSAGAKGVEGVNAFPREFTAVHALNPRVPLRVPLKGSIGIL